MRVTVTLHGTLRKFAPPQAGTAVTLDLSEGATVTDIFTQLGIPPGHAKIIVSGNQQLEPASALHEGQEVNLFPPLVGGC